MTTKRSNYANLDSETLLKDLGTTLTGLSQTEANLALKKYGSNELVKKSASHPVLRFLKLFISPLPLLLLILALISFLSGEVNGSTVILIMVFLSTLLAFTQEFKSNKAAEKLRSAVGTKANVIREGIECEIPLSQVAIGDIIQLRAGDIIPADVRIVQSKDLFVNESSLTGEALPVEKFNRLKVEAVKNDLELSNLCFMGSYVLSGMGKAVVFATGSETYFGGIAKEVVVQTKKTAFDKGVEQYIWLMIRFMAIMVPAVFLINGLIKGNWMEAFLFATAVAVGLTPEMLPMLVTINLAKGAMAMAKKHVIVKKLAAIQNFGAMDILCTDKTGTLTQDKVILEKYVDILGNENDRVLELAYLNSHYQSGLKNLLDVAILNHVDIHHKLHEGTSYEKVDEIPFDFERRRMSVIVEIDKRKRVLICKGAVEEVFNVCKFIDINGQIQTINHEHEESIKALTDKLNSDGFRVIAIAYKDIDPSNTSFELDDESELILIGYVAFLDPPKDSAKPAITALKRAGVSVKILTGDNELVTRKICDEVGLHIDHVLLGYAIEEMSDAHLADAAESTIVFAKMTPQQKSRVIKALQSHGHIVGFMGDGINDSPGLKAADVGISVDTAVDIAKESADIILLEKNLLILQRGILEGRRVFANITKYIKMAASSNFGNMFSMVGASALLPFLPMAPIQILFNNLLYDFSQTAVASDYVDDELLSSPRQWDISNITRFILFIGPISSIFDYLTFGLLWFVLGAQSPDQSTVFHTGWFVESLLSQTLIVHIIRTGKIPFIESRPSRLLLLTTIGICLLGAILPYTPLATFLAMIPLPSEYWLGMLILLPSYLLLTQLVKQWLIKKYGLS